MKLNYDSNFASKSIHVFAGGRNAGKSIMQIASNKLFNLSYLLNSIYEGNELPPIDKYAQDLSACITDVLDSNMLEDFEIEFLDSVRKTCNDKEALMKLLLEGHTRDVFTSAESLIFKHRIQTKDDKSNTGM